MEFTKIAAVLCKLFGIDHIEVAEDIAGETFLAALETWPYKGVPPNPTAWLYAIAKNKTKNYLHRNQIYTGKVMPRLKQESNEQSLTGEPVEPEIDLSEKNITDSQLQMLFAVCHPTLPTEAQICLALRILCGFGIDEIANAFLSNKETINKRLFRAKEKLRSERKPIGFPPAAEIGQRLETVLLTLYLLYNEGYYSESQDAVLREDLCQEAMRLTYQLIQNESTNRPEVNALFSLMCFHASRFPARKDENGEIVLYADQDEALWDQTLIAKGAYHLHQASQGNTLSKYHLEASIAWWHTIKTDSKEKWENILQLYNRLLQIAYSPIAALNRTYALSKANGKQEAIVAAEQLKLTDNPYYYTLLGELYRDIDKGKVLSHLKTALTLARTKTDRKLIQRKLDSLEK
ncbi:DNA-directed RNA polymerase sigma-70 factor [Puia dinghuensis]|uniref:DNA-directed RNA polymerase sigma-70 factor n=2 Tax=Puia dinghuensis TaxID=1792502 RepID=A0A8J2UIC1_9BACT|nr:DNA-directed RNA polymerase sigma-70 factor [Puia dinghuensis]